MPRKGQSLSFKTKEQIKSSKQALMSSKYNWDIAKLYLDNIIKNGSVKRTRKHITLREFKENIQNGKSLKDMKKEGISKHLVQFMSNFCQGKIKLTKKQFEEDYLLGKSLDEISKKYNIVREDISFLRQLYSINRKGPKYIHRKKTEVPITVRQKELIIGSLAGDGKKISSSVVGFGHGVKQKNYLLWKYSELENLASKNSLKSWSNYDKRSNKDNVSWRFYTNANSDIEEIIALYYPEYEEEKEICQEILDQMSAFSVAVWYMDDGKTDHHERHRIRYPHRNYSPTFSFCTDSFSLLSCELIKDWFKDKWDIDTRLRNKGKRKKFDKIKYRIVIEKKSNDDFIKLIEPYILDSMRYKIDLKTYQKKRYSNQGERV